MAFTPQQLQDITSMMDAFIEEHRPSPEMRDLFDIGWRHEKQSVFLYEVRPLWNDRSKTHQHDFAKATWVKTRRIWNIYWQRANMKWELYEPLESVGNLQRFLIEVDKDPYHCFKG